MDIGKKVWVFPDGDIPAAGNKEPYGHESLVIFNPNKEEAFIDMSVYYTEKAPDVDIKIRVAGERVRCVRVDKEAGDTDKKIKIPFGQYALKLESNIPVVAQIGRMDVTQPNLAYYTVMGYSQ
ncbi:MAG: hypothetical protein KAX15_01485 [Candidatus Omnitrophica bacterium]|nr:hypothetical protein [Candidatus Omnitrophota bacterium]